MASVCGLVLSTATRVLRLQVRELEEELERMTAQLKSLQDSLEQETLSKVDLQNRIQSLKEELAFNKRVHEEVGSP